VSLVQGEEECGNIIYGDIMQNEKEQETLENIFM
jgi:hypothetical protein